MIPAEINGKVIRLDIYLKSNFPDPIKTDLTPINGPYFAGHPRIHINSL